MIALGDPQYPYVITTYRLTEHHTAGGMTRWLPWLAELQPQAFVEIGPALAEELGIANGDWVVVSTPRGEAEARALVTERLQPVRVRRRLVHQVGMPWHFGWQGLATGGIANDLTALVGDPNVEHPREQGVHVQPAERTVRAMSSTPSGRRCARRRPTPPGAPGSAGPSQPGIATSRLSDLTERDAARRRSRRASSPIPRSASAARPARWPASSGTGCPATATSTPASATTTRSTLSGTTWRHVAFIEQPGAGHAGAQPDWLMSSDVCKHCTHAGCLEACPTGAIIRTEFNTVVIQDDICNGCGYCVPACPFGVVELADIPPASAPAPVATDRRGHRAQPAQLAPSTRRAAPWRTNARSATTGWWTAWNRPAPKPAPPTRSSSATWTNCGRGPPSAWTTCMRAACTEAYLYGAQEGDPGATGGIGPLNAFFLLLDKPEVYNLPARPQLPQNNVLPGYVATALTALALGIGAALAFRRRG